MQQEVEEKCNAYLQKYIANRELPLEQRLREVHLDESHVHHHCKWKEGESLHDPADEYNLPLGKEKNKGERHCFLCAIQGEAPLQRGLPTDAAGVAPLSDWTFSPTCK